MPGLDHPPTHVRISEPHPAQKPPEAVTLPRLREFQPDGLTLDQPGQRLGRGRPGRVSLLRSVDIDNADAGRLAVISHQMSPVFD